jgi:hypothetical protein
MLTSLVASLVHVFAPWNAFYSDSRVAETVVISVHLVAMMVGGGIAIATDRDTLRATRTAIDMGPEVLERLHGSHRPVLIALLALFLSGLALATADLETFATSPIFLVKMSLVALLMINGAVLGRTEQQLRRGDAAEVLWRRLRWSTRVSLALWICVVIAGATLVNAG